MIALLALAARPVRADDIRLEQARRHYADLDYELVAADVASLLTDVTAPAAARVEGYYLMGASLVVLEQVAEASAAFEALLDLAPDHRLAPGTPPRIRAAFESARAARRVRLEEELATARGAEVKAVTLEVDAPSAVHGGLALVLHVRLADPSSLVSRIVLGYRRASTDGYTMRSVAAASNLDLTITGAELASDTAYRLAYFVEAQHANGALVRAVGDDANPRWIDVSAGQVPESRPLTRRWYFWAGVAVVAASAIAVPYIIYRATDVGPQTVVIH